MHVLSEHRYDGAMRSPKRRQRKIKIAFDYDRFAPSSRKFRQTLPRSESRRCDCAPIAADRRPPQKSDKTVLRRKAYLFMSTACGQFHPRPRSQNMFQLIRVRRSWVLVTFCTNHDLTIIGYTLICKETVVSQRQSTSARLSFFGDAAAAGPASSRWHRAHCASK